ncbi:hypothetical protein BBP40_003202 [Aspergillus hancockii]|nr:hypothetical protein BBP40_003202 [Aspergillus hancockii]
MGQKKAQSEKTMPSNDTTNVGFTLILEYLRKRLLCPNVLCQEAWPQTFQQIYTIRSPKVSNPVSFSGLKTSSNNSAYEAHAAKILRELHQSKEIEGRVSGKQTVYHALQSASNETTSKAIEPLNDDEIEHLQEQLSTLKSHAKKARVELITLCATPLVPDLRQNINLLEREKERIIENLTSIKGTNTMHVAAEDKADTEKEWERWQKHVNVRNRVCRDLWRRCLDVVPEDMSREELW